MAERLHEALAEGGSVVTPNRRLARAVKRDFDAARRTSGAGAWTSADVLPWSTWLERTFAELTREEPGVQVLAPAQELALWQQAIADSAYAHALLDTAATARVVREAWAQEHGWRLDVAGWRSGLHDDAKAYLAWATRFRERCAAGGWTSQAMLADAVASRLGHSRRIAQRLVFFGFDELSPQQQALLAALRSAGTIVDEVQPDGPVGEHRRLVFPGATDELAGVARLARDLLLADPGVSIGVVVPDLSRRRAEVARVFDDALEPDRVLAPHRPRPRAWNLSLGVPLSSCPLVQGALSILGLARGRLPLTAMGSLLRSPFLAGAEQEATRRALLDARLRSRGPLEVDLPTLQREAFARDREQPHACRILSARLERWTVSVRSAVALRQPPSAWSSTFLEVLAGLGWPGERPLDSEEYQTWEKWREVVAGLSVLDPVVGTLRYGDALSWLSRLAADTLFQPASADVPLQVLGVLESAGLRFDHLFVLGLHDEAWPPAPRPNPFLPIALQRAHRMPHASAEWELAFARRLVASWRRSARSVNFSHAARDDDRILRASPLIADLPPTAAAAWSGSGFAAAMLAQARVESFDDDLAPALPSGHEVRGGATVFENQAACPFRAYARHRLGARSLEEGRPGLDARERGTLVHRALAELWGALDSQARLLALDAPGVGAAVAGAVETAIDAMRRERPDAMQGVFAAIERDRLRALLERLLVVERGRAPFRVVERESPRALEWGGLRVQTRVDRVDELEDGSRVLLDYKTGKARVAAWIGDRPDAPQLPLYAVTDPGDVAAVAFVQIQARDVRFSGLSRYEALLPGVQTLEQAATSVGDLRDWSGLFAGWRTVLDTLAREFLAGHAAVAPKRYPHTCQYCDLGPFCRVREKFDQGPVASAEEAEDSPDA